MWPREVLGGAERRGRRARVSVTGSRLKRCDASSAVATARAPAPREPRGKTPGGAPGLGDAGAPLPPGGLLGAVRRPRAAPCPRSSGRGAAEPGGVALCASLASVKGRGGLGAPAVPETPSDPRGAEAGGRRGARPLPRAAGPGVSVRRATRTPAGRASADPSLPLPAGVREPQGHSCLTGEASKASGPRDLDLTCEASETPRS